MDRNAPPLNPLPPVVWLLAAPLIAMEIVVSLGAAGLAGGATGIGWRSDAIQRFAFAPDFLRAMWQAGQWPLDGLMRLVTYPLVQVQVTQTVFVVVFLLALGKFVGEIFRAWAVVAVVIGSSIGAAAIYTAVPWMEQALIGAWPPVYGLIGAFTYILWMGLGRRGAQGGPLRAFSLIGMLLGVQLLFAVLFGGGTQWVADLAGFAVGFALSFLVAPGGIARLRAMMRQR
jgi:membrane associated rhomboid family serine protease